MLTSNAKRIFCHNVTLVSHYALQEQKCFSNKSHLKSVSIAPHFLLARVQLSIFFPISLSSIYLATSFYLCPAECFQDILSNKQGILSGTTWYFSDISSDISARWAHESTSLDVNKANGMLTGNAKRIFLR